MTSKEKAIEILIQAFDNSGAFGVEGSIVFEQKYTPTTRQRLKAKNMALFAANVTLLEIEFTKELVGFNLSHIQYWKRVVSFIESYSNKESTNFDSEVESRFKAQIILKEVINTTKEIIEAFYPECPFKKCPNPKLCKDKCEGIEGLGHSSLHVPNRFA